MPQVSFSRRAFLAVAAAGAVSARHSPAQEPAASSSDAKFSTDVKVVNVLATVHDKQGEIISDLTKDDFDLSEEGRPQTIRYFTRETDLPLTLGLLIDTSLSQRRVLGEEKDASRRFIEKVLREDRDETFLIHFDHDTELLQDLTSSRAKLERALDNVELPEDARPQMRNGGGGGYPRGGGGYPGGGGGYPRGGRRSNQPGTTLYDAVYLASDELMRKQKGRKALILLTDGVAQREQDFSAGVDRIRAAIRHADLLDLVHRGGAAGGAAFRRWRFRPRQAEGRRIPPAHAGPKAGRQKDSAANLARDGRRFFRSLEEAVPRSDLRPDRGRTPQSVQPGFHAR